MAVVDGDLARPLMSVDDFYDDVASGLESPPGVGVPLAGVIQVPPLPTTSRVICVALKYSLHIEELSGDSSHPEKSETAPMSRALQRG
jgi:2-keto-4-pentenoate hydratase/2-oxohepta-3-ene-1,7-dioic acid hydratase in catechol pathway